MNHTLEIKKIKQEKDRLHFDFFVDNKALSQLLNIDRFDLGYCGFDLDIVEIDTTKFPNYNRKQIKTNKVNQFLGIAAPVNQLDSNKIVLYRCHCGVDYCGVISFTLEVKDEFVIWNNITYEDEFDDVEDEIKRREITPILALKFDKKQYHLAFQNYLSRYISKD